MLLAISTDSLETQQKYKAKLKAPFAFIADPEGTMLAKLFNAKTPIVDYAKRRTYVIGPDRKITRVDSGSDAIDPSGAINAVAELRDN